MHSERLRRRHGSWTITSHPLSRGRRALGAAAVVALAVGCGGGAEPPAVEPTSETLPAPAAEPSPEPTRAPTPVPQLVAAYECDGGLYVVAQLVPETDEAVLYLPGRTVRLAREESATGGRYSSGDVSFSSSGGYALIGVEWSERRCVENRRRSRLEAIKLSGAELWATGNEPGWSMEIHPDRLILVTDYGQRRIETPIPPHDLGAAEKRTVIQASGPGHELTVTLHRRPCVDTMSGETFDTAVELVLDGTTLNGCGQGLN